MIYDDMEMCDKCKAKQNSVPTAKIINPKPLQVGWLYGTNSQKIYDECCAAFGWDYSQRDQFSWGKPLYAVRADANKERDIWFIGHSNWTKTKTDNGAHENKIFSDKIEEYDDKAVSGAVLRDRITFAKRADGQYEFIGIFKPQKTRVIGKLRVFLKTDIKVYPDDLK